MRRLRYLVAIPLSVLPCSVTLAVVDPPVIEAAYNVYSTNIQNSPACHGAAANPARPDRIKLEALVAVLPDPNASYSIGSTHISPLVLAVLADDVSLVEKLFNEHAQLDYGLMSMSMDFASQYGSTAMIDTLIRHHVDPNAREPGSWTPLMLAGFKNRMDNVNALLRAGADVNYVVQVNGLTALRAALVCKNQVMVDALLQHGARVDERDEKLAAKVGINLNEVLPLENAHRP
jgi:ankyrin repeat protein